MSKKHKGSGFLGNVPTAVLWVAVGFAFVLLGLAITMLFISGDQKEYTRTVKEAPETTSEKALKEVKERTDKSLKDGEVRDALVEPVSKGDTNKSDELYNGFQDKTTDGARKVELAIIYADVLFAKDKQDKAISVVKQAEDYDDDKFVTANWLANVYARRSEFKKSADYFKAAASAAKSPHNTTGEGSGYFMDMAAQMQNQVKG